jgi:hypothetical protein
MGCDSYGLLRDASVRGLLPKVVCEFDPEIEAEFPANMSGRLTIAARGQQFSRKVVVPKGEPSNFLTETELRGRFAGLADAVVGAERAGRLADAVLAIDASAEIASPVHAAAPMPARGCRAIDAAAVATGPTPRFCRHDRACPGHLSRRWARYCITSGRSRIM